MNSRQSFTHPAKVAVSERDRDQAVKDFRDALSGLAKRLEEMRALVLKAVSAWDDLTSEE